jgi:hypothetical protein
MSPRFRPPGKTFKERWPQEAEETRYFAATSYAVVLGGVLGVLAVPLTIWAEVSAAPIALVVVLAILAFITVAIPRVRGSARRWLALAWKIVAWVLAAAAVGLIVETLALAMCDETCRAALGPGKGASGMLFAYALLVAGSIGIAIAVDRLGNSLRRRTPGPAAP